MKGEGRYWRLSVRISEADRLILRTAARAARMSVADHLRRLLGLPERSGPRTRKTFEAVGEADPAQPQEDGPDF